MPNVRVVRGGFGSDATFGILVREDTEAAIGVTLEPERDHNRPTTWANGKKVKGGACIPAGRYLFQRTISPKFGETFKGIGIPNRSEVLFHALNIDEQSDGCIGIGHGFDLVQVAGHPLQDGIVQSKKEFAEFMQMQAGVDSFWVTVIDAIPEQ